MTKSIKQQQGRARACVAGLAVAAALMCTAAFAHATEIIPSVGLTSSVHDADHVTNPSAGLALRGEAGLFAPEVAVNYRQEELFDGALKQRMWPVTASLWLKPVPMVYGGAGVGWYYTSYDYDQVRFPLVKDETRSDFGVHVGAGLKIPVTPVAGLDVQGRYVMMREQQSHLVPEKFKPDFWTLQAGLALHF